MYAREEHPYWLGDNHWAANAVRLVLGDREGGRSPPLHAQARQAKVAVNRCKGRLGGDGCGPLLVMNSTKSMTASPPTTDIKSLIRDGSFVPRTAAH